MARAFDFGSGASSRARLRQGGDCAHCGSDLTDLLEHAHHVIPNQAGRRGDPADTFLRSADNCVILCDDCHQSAHAHGDYRHGAVAPPSWFVYSHGRTGQLQHGMWVQRVEVEWRRIATRR